jgi:positive regulator of sigma E activity
MIEKAIVCEIDGISVKVMAEQICGGSCATCGMDGKHAKAFTILNKNNLSVKTGDLVEYYIPARAVILSAFGVFVLPLILFIIFYYTAKNLLDPANTSIPFFCGLGGIALGFLTAIVIKAVRRKDDLPEITKVISSTDTSKIE